MAGLGRDWTLSLCDSTGALTGGGWQKGSGPGAGWGGALLVVPLCSQGASSHTHRITLSYDGYTPHKY